MNKTLSWIEVLAGIWLIISPWVLQFSAEAGATYNSVILGLIVGIIGLVAVFGKGGAKTGGTEM
ncbi:SPW repeat protein [bacterium]|nr:SPW repeat protein [bacterium]